MTAKRKAAGLRIAAARLAEDPDIFRKLGALGGAKTGKKGFAVNPRLASEAGKKGSAVRVANMRKNGQ